jgi:hypothetical protein
LLFVKKDFCKTKQELEMAKLLMEIATQQNAE